RLAGIAQLIDRRAAPYHLAELVVHHHQLEQADAAFVSRVVADLAAAAFVNLLAAELIDRHAEVNDLFFGRSRFLAALAANAADEPLGQDRLDGGRDEESGDAHVLHAGDRAGGVVGV